MFKFIETCEEVKKGVSRGSGYPEFGKDWCYGYLKSEMNDEPTDVCDQCQYYAGREEDESNE
jgi:hypothetical protein